MYNPSFFRGMQVECACVVEASESVEISRRMSTGNLKVHQTLFKERMDTFAR